MIAVALMLALAGGLMLWSAIAGQSAADLLRPYLAPEGQP